MSGNLYTFNSTVQNYGDFWAGLPWTAIGCATFRSNLRIENATRRFQSFVQQLERRIHCPIAYIAVPERKRVSGLGFPAIRLHWHFLMASPERLKGRLIDGAQALWVARHGNSKVDEYDPAMAGAYYVSKTAGSGDFEYIESNLDRLPISDGDDLVSVFNRSPYVPPHVKDHPAFRTLVMRDPLTKLPLSSAK